VEASTVQTSISGKVWRPGRNFSFSVDIENTEFEMWQNIVYN
jgi:hypothetical protein